MIPTGWVGLKHDEYKVNESQLINGVYKYLIFCYLTSPPFRLLSPNGSVRAKSRPPGIFAFGRMATVFMRSHTSGCVEPFKLSCFPAFKQFCSVSRSFLEIIFRTSRCILKVYTSQIFNYGRLYRVCFVNSAPI